MNSDNIIEQLAIEGWAKKKKEKKISVRYAIMKEDRSISKSVSSISRIF